MSSASQGRRFEFVDALRGFAALAVVLPHAAGLFIYPHPSWLSRLFLWLAEYGGASVEIFFVVSGFAIAYSLRNVATEGFTLGRFMLRRAVRLDPPYWVGMLMIGLVVAFRARATHQAIELPSPGKVVAHLLYLQDLLGIGQFNVVFWTLCLEFQLYLVFAVLMRSLSSSSYRPRESNSGIWREADAYGWLMVLAFFLSLSLSHTVWPMLPGWFVPFFYLFVSGSLAAWKILDRISDRLFQLCLLAMGLALLLRPEWPRIVGFLTAVLLYVAIRRDGLHRWLRGRAAQFLGRISYSIYLVHGPLTVFFLGIRTRVAADSKVVSLLCLAGLYLSTIALASLLHRVVELPCLRLSQQLKRSPSVAAAGVRHAPPA
ncbi:MAG TPA: acyltransferase [Polyangiaceae bacterium]|nr:acyltransferase [Polyangiaceae bacterium]